jgi:hypothetical protein
MSQSGSHYGSVDESLSEIAIQQLLAYALMVALRSTIAIRRHPNMHRSGNEEGPCCSVEAYTEEYLLSNDPAGMF